jgi:putative membrane protein
MTASEPGAWRRLHPASFLVNLIPTAWRTLWSLWPLVVGALWGGREQGAVVDVVFILLFSLAAVGRTLLHFLTLRYRLFDGRLEIQSGLFSRVEQAFDPSRIQNVGIRQNVFHRMAGLVELRVEMAGASGLLASDGLLSALALEDAEALRAAIGRPGARVSAPAAEHAALDAPGVLEIVAYGASSGRAGMAGAGLAVMLDVSARVAPGLLPVVPSGRTGWVGVALLSVALGYVVSVGAAVLRWHGARWWIAGEHLHFEGGLFTRQRVDIPLRKLQLVQVSEPIVRRAMGFASLLFETAAAAGPPEPGGTTTEGVVPMVAREDVGGRVRATFPELEVSPDGALRPAARGAFVVALAGSLVAWAPPLAVMLGLTGEPALLLVLPVVVGVAWLDVRWQGWEVTPRFMVMRRGFLSRNTWVLPREKLQSVRWVQGPLQRALGIGTVVVWFPGGRLPLPLMGEAHGRRLFAALAHAG